MFPIAKETKHHRVPMSSFNVIQPGNFSEKEFCLTTGSELAPQFKILSHLGFEWWEWMSKCFLGGWFFLLIYVFWLSMEEAMIFLRTDGKDPKNKA